MPLERDQGAARLEPGKETLPGRTPESSLLAFLLPLLSDPPQLQIPPLSPPVVLGMLLQESRGEERLEGGRGVEAK